MHRALEEATEGGASQPAASTGPAGGAVTRCWPAVLLDSAGRAVRRIALDGQAYTWPQYVEAYGDDAQRCWNEAHAIAMPQNANSGASGASQPTAPFIAPSPAKPSPSQPVIGRREAVLALTYLLNACWNNKAGAVDITDGIAFDWKRFFANTMENLEIAAMDLEKVFVLRTADSGSPQLAVCTTGTSWKILDPNQSNYKKSRLPGLHNMSSDWRMEPLFLQAEIGCRNWLQLR